MTELPLEISCQEFEQQRSLDDEFFLLDCREQEEYDLVAIAGATLLPMSELATRVAELAGKEQRRICVYCHHGVRSARVAAWLRQQGFERACSLAGGIDAWACEIEPGIVRY